LRRHGAHVGRSCDRASVSLRKRYHGLYDRVFISQFDVACISEAAAQQAAAEVKAAQASAGEANVPASAAPTPAAAPAASVPVADSDPLPLNRLLKPNAVVTVETVKSVSLIGVLRAIGEVFCVEFLPDPGAMLASSVSSRRFLPVTAAVKAAYVSRVEAICRSAGWQPAEPSTSAWSAGCAHSWTGRAIEQPSEEQERQDAEKQPARLNFRFPAQSLASKA
jgi:hypothetical protein